MIKRPRLLVLFPNEWDRDQFARYRNPSDPEFIYHGGDFFRFPGFLRLPFFDPLRFIRRTARLARRLQVNGVLSSDEFIGAVLAAAAARELDLPGADPVALLRAQHKYHSRRAQNAADPERAVRTELMPHATDSESRPDLPFPYFVKPSRGTFSLFARRVADADELDRALHFNFFERRLLRLLARPFNRMLEAFARLEGDADRFVAEELIGGRQVTVDGFVWRGEVTIMGTVDSVMYPGTNVFERFEYPSRLPAPAVAGVEAAAARAVTAIGMRDGQFNVELFYDAPSQRVRVIEINPRLSYQFADLYENVDGTNSYDVLLDLSLGRRPAFARRAGPFRFSASFVLRAFEGRRLTRVPGTDEVGDFNRRYPESRIRVYGRPGRSFAPEMRAAGNARMGIVNVGAGSLLDLFAIYEDARSSLDFRYE